MSAAPMDLEAVRRWASTSGIHVRWAGDYTLDPARTDRQARLAERPLDFDYRVNPCIDFGRLQECIPPFTVRPTDVDQLSECMRFFAERGIRYKIRGAGHTAGGQVLTASGAVIETGDLTRVIADDRERDLVTVEGGAHWVQVADYLRPQGRRPLMLTDQVHTTVAGTLSVGGFCDTSHLHGLQIAGVTGLTLVTPQGDRRELTPKDELFGYALSGVGQLGVIAQVTMRTMRAPATLSVRNLRWATVADYVRDATLICENKLYDFMRGRIVWDHRGGQPFVDATVGNFTEHLVTEDAALPFISPVLMSRFEHADLLEQLRADALRHWNWMNPALELVLPLPQGLGLWSRLAEMVVAGSVHKYFRRGAGAMVLPCKPRLPLAPLPDSDHCLIVALRPRSQADAAPALVSALREIAKEALEGGAKIYMMGVEEMGARELGLQFGDAGLARFEALKTQLDPTALCNPGLLVDSP